MAILVPSSLLVKLFAQYGMTQIKAVNWATPLSHALTAAGITTPQRIAMFLAQVGVETGGFRNLVENLNYSAEGLHRTWPGRFPTIAFASQYARQPEKIANFVYGSRMGNRGVASGDGWRFRGRGCKMTTGRDNYTALARALNRPLDTLPEYLETQEGAIASAIVFWQQNNLASYADRGDVEGCTRKVNGGTIGLAERKKLYALVMTHLTAGNA